MPSDDESPPKEFLRPLSAVPAALATSSQSNTTVNGVTGPKRPYQIKFPSRDEEIRYTQKLRSRCDQYDGDPDSLITWLNATHACLTGEGYPETDHPFIIRQLLTGEGLDYYLAHEDLIFNFCDLRKLFLHKQNVLNPLRTLPSLDSGPSVPLNPSHSFLTSTQLPTVSTSMACGIPPAATTFSFAQSLEDLTQHDIRKTIIEDLHRNTPKFTGDQRHDVIKWLKSLELKFDVAEIPTTKKFQLISQLLDKGALDWFQENKEKFGSSWEDFVAQFKKTFDSPNRARLALQKLQAYAQSPQQDVRSFCSEMRKLCKDADPQMSPSMKLEFLLAKISATYRLDLLKQKPKDPEEFELMAKDLENTHLIYDAIHQNTPMTWSSNPGYEFSSTDVSASLVPHAAAFPPSRQYPRRPLVSSPNVESRLRLPSSSVTPSRTSHSGFRSQPRFDRSYHNTGSRPFSARYSSPSFTGSHRSPLVSAIPSLMSTPIPAPLVPSPPPLPSDPLSAVVCQLCDDIGHSARQCPF